MQADNFVAFITVFGFFTALIFSILNTATAEDFLSTVALVSFFFYLFSHLSVSYFVRFLATSKETKLKTEFEKMSDKFKNELAKREALISDPFDVQSTYERKSLFANSGE